MIFPLLPFLSICAQREEKKKKKVIQRLLQCLKYQRLRNSKRIQINQIFSSFHLLEYRVSSSGTRGTHVQNTLWTLLVLIQFWGSTFQKPIILAKEQARGCMLFFSHLWAKTAFHNKNKNKNKNQCNPSALSCLRQKSSLFTPSRRNFQPLVECNKCSFPVTAICSHSSLERPKDSAFPGMSPFPSPQNVALPLTPFSHGNITDD